MFRDELVPCFEMPERTCCVGCEGHWALGTRHRRGLETRVGAPLIRLYMSKFLTHIKDAVRKKVRLTAQTIDFIEFFKLF